MLFEFLKITNIDMLISNSVVTNTEIEINLQFYGHERQILVNTIELYICWQKTF